MPLNEDEIQALSKIESQIDYLDKKESKKNFYKLLGVFLFIFIILLIKFL